MEYFNDRNNVDQYIQMADGFDGRDLIENLKRYLPPASKVLEIGMGPGKDLDILSEFYSVAGSDFSEIFLNMYREKHPTADLMLLNAVDIKTDRIFDCIYSNKVLHHLTKSDLCCSIKRQKELIPKGGLLMHSFWYGDKEESYNGLRFVYYTETTIESAIGSGFEVVALERYKELEDDDSFYVILRKLSDL